MKADFLFVGLNLYRRKRQKHTFHEWSFENKEHQVYLNVVTRLLLNALPLVKFLATRLVAQCPLLVFTKRYCGL